jgi:SAV_6107-like HEPN
VLVFEQTFDNGGDDMATSHRVQRPPRPGTATGSGPGSARLLASQARRGLAAARRESDAGERFRLAHLAALRSAAVVFAERGRPASARRRLVNAWVLLETVAPEFAEWAAYFAAGAPVRAAIEAGAIGAVSLRDADDQLRAAEEFLQLVESSAGMLAAALAS